MNYVEEAVRVWELYRAGVIAEVELVPEEQLGFRPAPESRTVRALARHIAEASVAFVDQLLLEDGSFMRLFDPATQQAVRARMPKSDTKAELVEMLRTTGADNAKRLRDAGEPLATQTMKAAAGPQSRLTSLHFALSHEMYHRGQLAMLVRQLGLTPALTQQMQQRKK